MTKFIDLEIQLPSPFVNRAFSVDISTTLLAHGVTALFGPSGAGKTTTLRALTGLPKQKNLYARLNQTVFQDNKTYITPEKRQIIYVSSERQLFPHLTVSQNWQYAQKRAHNNISGLQKKHIAQTNSHHLNLDTLAERFGVSHLQSALPSTLSTGETQKVTLIRAILSAPRVLLLDEPLGNIDYAEKNKLIRFIREIASDFRIPILYVSHHPDEICALAKHVLLMKAGRVIEHGPIEQIKHRLFSAEKTPARTGVISLSPAVDVDFTSCEPSKIIALQKGGDTKEYTVTLSSEHKTFTSMASADFVESRALAVGKTVYFCHA